MLMLSLVTAAVTGILSFVVARWLSRHGDRVGLVDRPNDRSLHVSVTPRAGGAGFALLVPCAVASAVWLTIGIEARQVTILLTALGVAIVGFADDRWGLPALLRFLLQIAAAAAVVTSGVVLSTISLPGATLTLGPLAVPLTIAWIVGLTNVYNFMDGIDGIAATQALVTTAALGGVCVILGRYDLGLTMLIEGAGVLGFLGLNWPPARVFMGDVGSTFLGFTFAACSIFGTIGQPRVPFLAWIVVLSPFLADALITIARRIMRGEALWKAHRTHFYQRLVQSGWTHKRTTLLYGACAMWAGSLTVLHYGFLMPSEAVYVPAALMPLLLPPLLLSRQPLPGAVH
jgi:UDP-N-acetylmuramyl pentapeptide phosphotransferase/UDP-N-acetylglucosamine-1-phosphate transferase